MGDRNRPLKESKSGGAASAMATMRNLGRTFGAARINVLEKMGKRETTETEEMANEYKQVEETRTHLKDVYKKMLKANKSSAIYIEDQQLVAQAMREYGNKLATNGQHPTLAGMFVRLAEFQEYVDDLRAKLDFLMGLNVAEALKDFVKGDVRDARYEKKKFDRVRQTFESATENLKRAKEGKSKTQLQQAQEDYDQQKVNYERAGFETLAKIKDCNSKNNFETLEKACNYVDAYHDYFQKGFSWLSEMSTRIPKHRESIAQLKQNYGEEQKKRKHHLDVNGNLKPIVFGAPLPDICTREKVIIPSVITKSIAFLSSPEALETEGIFRVSGQKVHVDALKAQFEAGKNPDFPKTSDPHVISGLLKQFFRELPSPLLTWQLYDRWMEAYHASEYHEVRAPIIKQILTELPHFNRDTLKVLIGLCVEVTKRADKNRMTASNLSTVLGPNLIYRKDQNAFNMKGDLDMANSIVETLIDQYDFLFGGDAHPRPSKRGSFLAPRPQLSPSPSTSDVESDMSNSGNYPLSNSGNYPLSNSNSSQNLSPPQTPLAMPVTPPGLRNSANPDEISPRSPKGPPPLPPAPSPRIARKESAKETMLPEIEDEGSPSPSPTWTSPIHATGSPQSGWAMARVNRSSSRAEEE